MTGQPAASAPEVTDPNVHVEGRSFDWHVYRRGTYGERITGAVGVSGVLDRAKERVVEALDEIPVGVVAQAVIQLVHAAGPPRRTVARAVREHDGRITWTYPPR